MLYTKPRKPVRSEVFTSVTMKYAVFWNVKPSSYLTGDTLRLRYSAQPVNAIVTCLTGGRRY
jgi:hypothetical protein